MDDASDRSRADPASRQDARDEARRAAPRAAARVSRPAGPAGGGEPGDGPSADTVYGDPRPWAALADAADAEAFFAAWLGLQIRLIPGAVNGCLFLFSDGAGFSPVARFPAADAPAEALQQAASAAAASGSLHVAQEEGATILAAPVIASGRVRAVAAISLAGPRSRELRAAARRLHWGLGRLSAHLMEREAQEARRFVARAETALDLLAAADEHPRYDAAAMAIANELQTLLRASAVAIGLAEGKGRSARVRLAAMSRAAWFRRRSALKDALENAMGEAIDQGRTVVWPAQGEGASVISVAARDCAEASGAAALAVFVLADNDGPCGALVVERRDAGPWDEEVVALGEALGGLLGPNLALKKRQRRWISGRVADGLGDAVRAVFGPRRPSLKLAAVLGAAFLGYVATVDTTFRVSADASLEGAVQRAAAAPFEGFLASARARPGDVVQAGEVIASLDDADLELEAMRWRSEYARIRQEQRAAMAELNRAEVALLSVRLEQAQARLALAQARLARTEIKAPISGMVISGDLSQRLGTPVSQGDVLFEIAPLEGFRVVIGARERDLRHLAAGQTGALLLAGRADAAAPLVVERVTAVAHAAEGANLFRVEARLTGGTAGLRPGMEGVAKIDVAPRPILWVWTRTLFDRLRVLFWEWTP